MKWVILEEAHGGPHTHAEPSADHANEEGVSGVIGVVMRGVDRTRYAGRVKVELGGGMLDARVEAQEEELQRAEDDLSDGEGDRVRNRSG